MSTRLQRASIGVSALVMGGGLSQWSTTLSPYGAVAASAFAARMFLSASNRPRTGAFTGRVAVVVPAYNEDPVTLRACIDSVLAQTRRPDTVVVVDDGSDVEVEPYRIEDVEHCGFTHNMGKREALAMGMMMASDFDVVVTVDSDTRLAPDALEHLVAAFADPEVMAATGFVAAANRDANLLTRMIDVRYTTSFEVDRAAQSRLSAMLCACGSLAAYRSGAQTETLEDFTHQTFRGHIVQAGDDRRLTALALRHGRTVYIPEAVAYTVVPERLGHWLRQQRRWNASWARETLLGLVELRGRARVVLLAEAVVALGFSGALLVSLAAGALGAHHPTLLAWAAATLVWTTLRTLVVLGRRDLSWGARVLGLVVAPLYGLLHLASFVPLRAAGAWELFRAPRWGTRADIEVRS